MPDFDMDPDAVTHGINQLRAAGDNFSSAWQRHKQSLQSHQSGFGSDEVTQAFLSRYQPVADNLFASAEELPTRYGRLYDDTMGCVHDYRAADTDGANTVTRSTGTDRPVQES
ncbi:hypothetical protein [Amycolatopsis nigrescens]|uniref:hypothetical protein n=1 Tax=Amycolatopsis nigrescens TaxID=381445 RepID=UPI00036A1ED9|nr:hypothetical protein [Amycolatopsis nigrescens]